jgi:peptide/nickel transport system substrate-binding protein
MREGHMNKKKLIGWGLCVISVFVFIIYTLIVGSAGAAEKAASKVTPTTAPKAAVKAVLKVQPQTGGVLKIIELYGPKAPFGWPVESAATMVDSKPVCIEALLRQLQGGLIGPWLATAWKVAPDKSSITFTLRKGVKFHDGTDFNAEAAKFNLEAVRGKKVGTEDWTSIDVVDNYTVRINLSHYTNDLLSLFAGREAVGTMVSPTAFNKNGIEWIRWNPVGTGPFEFVSFERDVRTKYKRFDNYWQKGKPYLDGIEYIYIKDPMTQSAAIQAGDAHILNIEAGKMAADLKALGLFNIYFIEAGTVVLIPDSMNADSPLANRKVREAIEYAIDKEAIAKAKSYGFWQPAYQLPSSGGIGYVKNFQGRRYNLAKAKQLLVEAGYPKGFKIRIIPHFAIDRDIAVIIQGYMNAVGIQVDLEFVDQAKYIDYRKKGWRNGLLFQAFALHSNYLKTLEGYVASDNLDFPSLKEPAVMPALFRETLSTVNMEIPRVQKLLKALYDDVTITTVHTMGRASIQQKNVHDAGSFTLGVLSDWTPENTWLSK